MIMLSKCVIKKLLSKQELKLKKKRRLFLKKLLKNVQKLRQNLDLRLLKN